MIELEFATVLAGESIENRLAYPGRLRPCPPARRSRRVLSLSATSAARHWVMTGVASPYTDSSPD
ncbi:MAG: hypothetical protein F4107_04995 [Gemmatimonadetes bacterium]|nr:hypothetical protein [Dehalococcoidia bacterium]MYI65287.1 hypothetical protein [Gemmatimonadota bacterium]